MPTTLYCGESKIPAVLIAYLGTRRTDTDYPTPADADCPLVAGPVKQATKRTQPSLEVWVESLAFPDRRDAELYTVHLDLHAHPDTPLATELGWLAAFRRSFAGGPIANQSNATDAGTNPFFKYLNGLTDGEAWRFDSLHITSGSIIVLEGQRIVYRTTLEANFRSITFTV